jgi:metallo-beta-lactamase family protein
LAYARGFHIILAASGMCEAGRIRHHLKNWLSRDAATLLLVGYQAEATLGRLLQDGVTPVRIQGEEFTVRARIRSIDLYSGHADGPELAQWITERAPIRHGLFLVHGEEEAMSGLAARLTDVPQDRLAVPSLDDSYTLTPDGFVKQANAAPPRLPPEQVARLDWHNDVSRLILDINAALREVPDEKGRAVLIRRLRRALEEDGHMPPPRKPVRRRQ